MLIICVHRVNDWLLKINDVDLANKDRKQVVKAVLTGGGLINMVVRRRKSLGGRLITPVHINLAGHKGTSERSIDRDTRLLQSFHGLSLCASDSGIGLESGVFVTAIVQGSPAAREGSLTVGDRLIAVSRLPGNPPSLIYFIHIYLYPPPER